MVYGFLGVSALNRVAAMLLGHHSSQAPVPSQLTTAAYINLIFSFRVGKVMSLYPFVGFCLAAFCFGIFVCFIFGIVFSLFCCFFFILCFLVRFCFVLGSVLLIRVYV